MKEQFVESWRINNRVNLMLLDGIPEEALKATLSKRGGGTPLKQFAHIQNVRFWRLESIDPQLVIGQTKFSLKELPDQEEIRYKLIESSDAIGKILEKGYEEEGVVKGFRRGVFVLQSYLIAHESHHRGNIMLTLKQCGYKLPKSLTYGIWDWNKI